MTQSSALEKSAWDRGAKFLFAAIVLGMMTRIALSAISWGTLDATTWRDFAYAISQRGLLQLYADRTDFNHPPIPGLWSLIAWRASGPLHVSFPFVFRLPVIAADGLVCWLLFKIWRSRGASRRSALLIAALFAWSLDAILVSAHHGNTDSIYAALALLSVYLAETVGAHFFAGLALGAAINIKLIPVLLLIPMIGAYRDRGDFARVTKFLAGLACGAIPFAPVLFIAGKSFVRNAIEYQSNVTYWGVNAFLKPLAREPRFSVWSQPIMDHYHDLGRYLILASVLLIVLVMRRRAASMRTDRYTTSAITASLFLILAPGFGVQYTVLAGAMLFAVQLAPAVVYGLMAGLYLAITYYLGWQGGSPIDSSHGSEPAPPSELFGIVAWATLIWFVWTRLRPGHRSARS